MKKRYKLVIGFIILVAALSFFFLAPIYSIYIGNFTNYGVVVGQPLTEKVSISYYFFRIGVVWIQSCGPPFFVWQTPVIACLIKPP